MSHFCNLLVKSGFKRKKEKTRPQLVNHLPMALRDSPTRDEEENGTKQKEIRLDILLYKANFLNSAGVNPYASRNKR